MARHWNSPTGLSARLQQHLQRDRSYCDSEGSSFDAGEARWEVSGERRGEKCYPDDEPPRAASASVHVGYIVRRWGRLKSQQQSEFAMRGSSGNEASAATACLEHIPHIPCGLGRRRKREMSTIGRTAVYHRRHGLPRAVAEDSGSDPKKLWWRKLLTTRLGAIVLVSAPASASSLAYPLPCSRLPCGALGATPCPWPDDLMILY